jgi:hypothetical protein
MSAPLLEGGVDMHAGMTKPAQLLTPNRADSFPTTRRYSAFWGLVLRTSDESSDFK